MEARRIEIVNLDFIKIGPRHRELREEQVSSLVQSIAKIGLKTPITVRQATPEDDMLLVAGAHRLEACKRLFMDEIEAFVIENDDEKAARMWEIAENLHRAELTALERSEHVSEWIRLAEQKAAHLSSQLATKGPFKSGEKAHRPESGVRAAARELNIDKDDAHRAVKVASLSHAAKEAARETGLDDNRSALLDAADKKTEEQQADRIRQIAREKEMRRQLRQQKPEDPAERQLMALHKAWDAADSDARARFLENIGVTSFVGIEL